MDNRFNTAAGWVLFAGIIALGLTSISSRLYHSERPENLGYPIEVVGGADEAAAEMTMAAALNMESTTIAAGEKVFAKCLACHSIESGGADGIGPNLYGIMGATIGNHSPGFAYSSALTEKGGVWDWENMSAWLKSPRAFADGTKMSFAGLSKIEDRAAIALYMNSMGSNLAVPEYIAEASNEEAAAAEAEQEAGTEGENAAEAEADQDAAAEQNEGGE